jgi:hypothetical protein
LTSATCSGGKTARATRARLVLQPLQAIDGESSSPPPHQTRRGIKTRRDLGVVLPLGGIEHDPGPLHVLERQLLRPRHPLQHAPLVITELDPVTRRTRHRHIPSPARPTPSPQFQPILPAASTSNGGGRRAPRVGEGTRRVRPCSEAMHRTCHPDAPRLHAARGTTDRTYPAARDRSLGSQARARLPSTE